MAHSTHVTRRIILAGAAALAILAATGPGIAQEAQRGGTMVVASIQKPRHLNAAVQSGMATAVPAAQIFATLLRYGENFEPQPYLAESWAFSEDSKTLTLKLREGAKFHDG